MERPALSRFRFLIWPVVLVVAVGGCSAQSLTVAPTPWHKLREAAAVSSAGSGGDIMVGWYKKLGPECAASSAGEGNVYLGVAVGYVGGLKGLSYDPNNWTGHSEASVQYETTPAFICYDSDVLGAGRLGSGIRASGYILFEIPDGTEHFYVTWRESFSGLVETWELF